MGKASLPQERPQEMRPAAIAVTPRADCPWPGAPGPALARQSQKGRGNDEGGLEIAGRERRRGARER